MGHHMKHKILLLIILVIASIISGCCCCTNTVNPRDNQPTVNPSILNKPSPTVTINTSPTFILSATVNPTTVKTASGHDASLEALTKEFKNMIYENYKVKSYSEIWWDATNPKMTIGVDWPTDTVDIFVDLIGKDDSTKEYSGDIFILKFNSNEEANAFITDGDKWHGYTVNDPTDTKNALTSTQSFKTGYEPLSGFRLYERVNGHKPGISNVYFNTKNPTTFSSLVTYFVQADNIVIESEMLEMEAW